MCWVFERVCVERVWSRDFVGGESYHAGSTSSPLASCRKGTVPLPTSSSSSACASFGGLPPRDCAVLCLCCCWWAAADMEELRDLM